MSEICVLRTLACQHAAVFTIMSYGLYGYYKTLELVGIKQHCCMQAAISLVQLKPTINLDAPKMCA